VFDRTLLRAGETVSMKHFVRTETTKGLAYVNTEELPTRLKIVHQGSGQEYVQPVQWNGQRSAVSNWPIPPAAKLGSYSVTLEREIAPDARGDRRLPRRPSGEFRVEEFRVPLVDARVSGPMACRRAPRAPAQCAIELLVRRWMAQAPARVSALLRSALTFPGYDAFSFEPPRDLRRWAQQTSRA
jgi:hypothetical protein